MIEHDQPRVFPAGVLVRVSSRSDGTMLDRAVGVHNPAVVTNRTKFTDENGVSYGDVVYQRIVYDEHQTYDHIENVDDSSTCKFVDEVRADALVTSTPGVGLLLPVADCVAAVVYDPIDKRVALAHLGRHSTLAGLMNKVINHMAALGSNTADLIIWMAPSVQRNSYRMEYFDHIDDSRWRDYCDERDGGIYLDLPGYNRAQAIEAGVLPENIDVSRVDTAKDPEYFSHSQGDTTGRFGVLVKL